MISYEYLVKYLMCESVGKMYYCMPLIFRCKIKEDSEKKFDQSSSLSLANEVNNSEQL